MAEQHCIDCNCILNKKEIAYGEGACFPCLKGNQNEDDE